MIGKSGFPLGDAFSCTTQGNVTLITVTAGGDWTGGGAWAAFFDRTK